MKPIFKIEFYYDGLKVGVTDLEYYPGFEGNYNNPPDDPELYLNDLWYQRSEDKEWVEIPKDFWFLLNNESFMDIAMVAYLNSLDSPDYVEDPDE